MTNAVIAQADSDSSGRRDQNKALGFDWYLGNVLMNNGSVPAPGGILPSGQDWQSAGRSDFSSTIAATESLNYQPSFDASAPPVLSNPVGDKVPLLADVPAL